MPTVNRSAFRATRQQAQAGLPDGSGGRVQAGLWYIHEDAVPLHKSNGEWRVVAGPFNSSVEAGEGIDVEEAIDLAIDVEWPESTEYFRHGFRSGWSGAATTRFVIDSPESRSFLRGHELGAAARAVARPSFHEIAADLQARSGSDPFKLMQIMREGGA